MKQAPILEVRLRQDDLWWLRDMLTAIGDSPAAQGGEHKKARRTLRRIIFQLESAKGEEHDRERGREAEEGSEGPRTNGPTTH